MKQQKWFTWMLICMMVLSMFPIPISAQETDSNDYPFLHAIDVAVDGDNNVYVLTRGLVKKMDSITGGVTDVSSDVAAFTVDVAGNVYIVKRTNGDLVKIDSNGNETTIASNIPEYNLGVTAGGKFYYSDNANGISVIDTNVENPQPQQVDDMAAILVSDIKTGLDGNVYVIAGNFVYDLYTISDSGITDKELSYNEGFLSFMNGAAMTIDNQGNVYIREVMSNSAIWKVGQDGSLQDAFTERNVQSAGFGMLSMAIDSNKNLYVVVYDHDYGEYGANVVKTIDEQGNVTLLEPTTNVEPDYDPVTEANKATTYSEMRAVLEHPITGNELDTDIVDLIGLSGSALIDITSLNGMTYNSLSDASKDFIADILLLNKEEDFLSEVGIRSAFIDILKSYFLLLIPIESKDNGLTSILLQFWLEEFGFGSEDKLINEIQYKIMAQHFIDNQPYEYSDILDLTDSDSNDGSLFSKVLLFFGQYIPTVEPLANVTVNKGDSVTIDYSNVYPNGTLTVTSGDNTLVTVSNNTGSAFDINGLTETTNALITITYKDPNDVVLFSGEMSVAVTDSGDAEVLFETSNNSDGTVTITKYNGTATEVEIPSEIDGKTITAIGNNVFKDKGLTSVELPNTITSFGEHAFSGNQLTKVEIKKTEGGKEIVIGADAFRDNQLTEVTLPPSVTKVGDNAFSHNEFTSLEFPGSLVTIGENAFSHNKLKSVTFSYMDTIGKGAFSYNELESVTINMRVNTIADSAFSHNKITSITLDSNRIGTIGDNAFSHNKLTSLTIKPQNEGMGKGAFSYNELESVTFELGVSKIADSAFSHNKLTSVTLPVSVSKIGNNAFASNQLERVTFNKDPQFALTIGMGAFNQDSPAFPEFDGWYTDESLQNAWNGISAPEGNELYAKRIPNPPTGVTATAGDAQATVSFTGSNHTDGNAVTEYTVKVYVDGIEQTDLLTTGKTSPITVKGLSNGTTYTFTVIAINAAGNSVETAQTTAVKPVKPGGNGNGNSGGGSPSQPSPNPSTDGGSSEKPTTEQITVPGSVSQDTFISETLITRNKDKNGILRDEAIFTDEQAKEAVQNTNSSLKENVRMVITDTKDEVSEVHVKVAKEAVEKLAHAGVNFEVYTDNVLIQVPRGSLDGFDKELFFRVTPIKEAEKKKEVETRAKAEEAVKQMSNGMTITLLGRPMTIETNMQNRPVTITLPLRDMELPTDPAKRNLFVADLVIFIEHSDGSKELVKPKLEKLENGEYGLQFGVDKFSTFTILKTDNLQDSSHEGYIKGFGDGTFKPNQSITRVHMAVMLARILGYTGSNEIGDAPFKDIQKNHINAGEIAYVKEKGIMNGYENGDFGASNTITRAEMATIVANYKQLEIVKNVPLTFPDTKGNWAQWIIEANKKAGIINGREDGTFGPNDSLTRAQAVVMINRMFDRGPLYGVITPSFSDVTTTHWAFNEVEEAAQSHFFTLRPKGREDVVK